MFKRNRGISHGAAAVVTGAGSGIGRSFALEIGRRGGDVLCVDINAASAEATAATLRASGRHAVALTCDVSDPEAVAALAGQAEGLLGRPVDLLVNNAGVGLGGMVGEVPLTDWQWCLGINLWGVIHGVHHFLPGMRRLPRSGIINVASAAGLVSAPAMAPYNVGKAGVVSLSETLAAELRGSGVRVNVLCPTMVPTNIVEATRAPAWMKQTGEQAMRFAMTTSDKVAGEALDNLDAGRLYTLPQPDAKLFWLLKRVSPGAFASLSGLAGKLSKTG